MRTAFIVDGFNLYHSLKDAQKDLGGACTRWLDLSLLCQSYLSAIGGGATLGDVRYYSALATHLEPRKPDVTQRHRDYIDCLEATGVSIHLGRFRPRPLRCPNCAGSITRHEEKETDVAIAAALFELLIPGPQEHEAAVLLTGDSDLAPAVRAAKGMFPGKRVSALFPYKRVSKELRQEVDGYSKIRAKRYAQTQLPDPAPRASGGSCSKPANW